MLKIVLPAILVVLALFVGGTLYVVWQQYDATRMTSASGGESVGLLNGFSFGGSAEVTDTAPTHDAIPVATHVTTLTALTSLTADRPTRVPSAQIRTPARGMILSYNGIDSTAQDVAIKIFNGIIVSQDQVSASYSAQDLPDDIQALVQMLPQARPAPVAPVAFTPTRTAVVDTAPAIPTFSPDPYVAPTTTSKAELPTVRRGAGGSAASCRIEKGARRCTIATR